MVFMTIYIGNLPYTLQEQALVDVFQEFGPIESVKIISDKITKRSKGYGFIEMKSPKDEAAAVDALDGKEVGGRKLKVSLANPKDQMR
jgi:RNA recognition motif-containing protein